MGRPAQRSAPNVRQLFDDPRLVPLDGWYFPSAVEDIETGDEIVISQAWKGGDIAVFVWDGMKKPKRKDWPVLFQGACGRLSESGVLTAFESRMFMHIFGLAGYGEPIILMQSDLARKWGVARSSVSKALKRLVELKVALVSESKYGKKAYRLNPNFGKGER